LVPHLFHLLLLSLYPSVGRALAIISRSPSGLGGGVDERQMLGAYHPDLRFSEACVRTLEYAFRDGQEILTFSPIS
jgi:hypothetical protein